METRQTRKPISNHNADDSVGDDEPARKRPRARVSKACGPCRKRKERCDGAQPRCQRCTRLDLVCSYHQSKKRGLRSGYVRGLEILLGLILKSYPESETLISSALGCDGEQSQPTPTEPVEPIQSSTRQISSLAESWRTSTVAEALQRTLMASGEDEDEESRLRHLDAKITSIFNVRICLKPNQRTCTQDTWSLKDTPQHAERSSSSNDFQFTPQPTQPSRNASTVSFPLASSSLEPHAAPTSSPQEQLPADWPRLIDQYVASTHCWLPIVEKYTLLRSASILTSNQSAPDRHSHQISSGDRASLWAALACGSSSVENSTEALALTYSTALRLAMQSCDVYEKGHVQSLLILSIIDLSEERWSSAWILVGKAVYIMATLGLLPFDGTNAEKSLTDPEKRLFRGCFILETLISSRLGFRTYLRSRDLQSVGNISVEGLEEWETWAPPANTSLAGQICGGPSKALSSFNILGSLAAIISQFEEAVRDGSDSGSVRIELLERYSRIESELSASIPSTGWETYDIKTHLDGPPHIIQLLFFAASLYGTLRNGVRSSLGAYPEELPKPRNPDVLKALSLLESNNAISDLFSSSNIPVTLPIFAHLLRNTRIRTLDNEADLQWQQSIQTTVSAGANGLAQHETVIDPNLFPAADSQTQPMMPPSTGLNHSELLQAGSSTRNEPQGSLPTHLGQDTSQNSAENHASRMIPLLLDSHSHSGDTSIGVLDPRLENPPPSGDQQGGKDMAGELPTDSSLFGQLSVLDTFDWPNISEDFMERLGYSRNGDVVDFQNLISFE